MNREIKFLSPLDKILSPPIQLFSFPGSHGSIIHTQSPVGDYQVGIDTQYLGKSFTGRAGAKRVIKRKKIRNRFFKLHSVHFEAVVEMEELVASCWLLVAGCRLLTAD